MRVSFPHFGYNYVLWKSFFRTLNLDVVIPPFTSRRTLDIGVRLCPEMLCTPCKLVLGNYVEALELGAEMLIMLGGHRVCRLGYSVKSHAELLQKQGFKFAYHVFDIFDAGNELNRIIDVLGSPGRLGKIEMLRLLYAKIEALDEAEKLAHRTRPRETVHGLTTKVFHECLPIIEETYSRREVERARETIRAMFSGIALDIKRPTVDVAIVGDPYTMLQPFFNMHIEEELGKLGAVVHRGFWLSNSTAFDPLGDILGTKHWYKVQRAADRYVRHDIGAFARDTVGEAVLFSESRIDGIIHLAAFDCTPEIITRNILPQLRQDYRVPILALAFDEHTGRQGLISRLEAFVDVLHKRRRRVRT